MVTQKLPRRFEILARDISKEFNLDLEKVKDSVEKSVDESRRQKAPPAPKGSIGIRQAARKYKMSPTTLSRWARLGWVNVVKTTPNWTYIDENSLIKAINRRKTINN